MLKGAPGGGGEAGGGVSSGIKVAGGGVGVGRPKSFSKKAMAGIQVFATKSRKDNIKIRPRIASGGNFWPVVLCGAWRENRTKVSVKLSINVVSLKEKSAGDTRHPSGLSQPRMLENETEKGQGLAFFR